MAYGEFIASSKSGRYHLYFNAIESNEWSFIDKQLEKQRTKTQNYDNDTRLFQWVVGQCMDKIHGETISIIDKPKCPSCLSEEWISINQEQVRYIDLLDVSFNRFNKLKRSEKEELINRLWRDGLKVFQ